MTVRTALVAMLLLASCRSAAPPHDFEMNFDTPVDAKLQRRLEEIDASIRAKYGMTPEQTDAGVLDLRTGRLAMMHPDHIEYAASVAKGGILFAWFVKHPEAATQLDPVTEHELGLMIKASSNEMAAKFSRELGLREIQEILNANGFYDASRGGGIWVGKHYGPNSERFGDPVGDHSHAVTVRQLIRFYWLLDQRKLVSAAASEKMIEIFRSPDIPHDDHKFVKALSGTGVTLLRKWGSWEDWLHDSAIIDGPGRRYVLVGLTHHPQGDAYLEDLARAVDGVMRQGAASRRIVEQIWKLRHVTHCSPRSSAQSIAGAVSCTAESAATSRVALPLCSIEHTPDSPPISTPRRQITPSRQER